MTPARILIADDDPAGRYLLVSTLTSAGYETYTAEDGAQALAVARGEAPDLIITDILMPQMDGYQLCREWEADPSLAHIPFIFYTANYADEEDERFVLSLGADRFLRKPLEPGALLAEVKTLLENHRPSGVLPQAHEAGRWGPRTAGVQRPTREQARASAGGGPAGQRPTRRDDERHRPCGRQADRGARPVHLRAPGAGSRPCCGHRAAHGPRPPVL